MKWRNSYGYDDDYTKWQRECFDAKTEEQISQEARAYAESNPHTGKAKIIL